jgi:EEF1A lysine methyltransferase 4
MPEYGDQSYWDERYSRNPDDAFEWLQSWKALKPLLDLSTDAEILNVGCGNAPLVQDMYDDGYRNITSVDTSPVVIQQQTMKHADKEEVEFSIMDATALEFPDECFDTVLDKSTMDAVLCGKSGSEGATEMVREAFRVLKSGGTYVVVSYGVPQARLYLLRTQAWDVQYTTLGKEKGPDEDGDRAGVHYVYICRKAKPQ